MRFTLALITLFTLLFIQTNAQTRDENLNTWWANISSIDIGEKFYIENEVHVRRNNGFEHWQQFLIRPSLQFRAVDKKLTLAAGYSYLVNYPYGIGRTFTGYEHNFWEQASVKNLICKTKLEHRYRMEHRYPATLDTEGNITGYAFKNRFRYRLTLKRKLGEESPWSIVLFDEAFLSFEGSSLRPAGLDQNWIYVGLKYKINKTMSIDLGYMNQYLKRSSTLRESNHTISTTFFVRV